MHRPLRAFRIQPQGLLLTPCASVSCFCPVAAVWPAEPAAYSPEQKQLQEMARKFAREEIMPRAAELDRTGEVCVVATRAAMADTAVPVGAYQEGTRSWSAEPPHPRTVRYAAARAPACVFVCVCVYEYICMCVCRMLCTAMLTSRRHVAGRGGGQHDLRGALVRLLGCADRNGGQRPCGSPVLSLCLSLSLSLSLSLYPM